MYLVQNSDSLRKTELFMHRTDTYNDDGNSNRVRCDHRIPMQSLLNAVWMDRSRGRVESDRGRARFSRRYRIEVPASRTHRGALAYQPAGSRSFRPFVSSSAASQSCVGTTFGYRAPWLLCPMQISLHGATLGAHRGSSSLVTDPHEPSHDTY